MQKPSAELSFRSLHVHHQNPFDIHLLPKWRKSWDKWEYNIIVQKRIITHLDIRHNDQHDGLWFKPLIHCYKNTCLIKWTLKTEFLKCGVDHNRTLTNKRGNKKIMYYNKTNTVTNTYFKNLKYTASHLWCKFSCHKQKW